jgi:hypothetical protein
MRVRGTSSNRTVGGPGRASLGPFGRLPAGHARRLEERSPLSRVLGGASEGLPGRGSRDARNGRPAVVTTTTSALSQSMSEASVSRSSVDAPGARPQRVHAARQTRRPITQSRGTGPSPEPSRRGVAWLRDSRTTRSQQANRRPGTTTWVAWFDGSGIASPATDSTVSAWKSQLGLLLEPVTTCGGDRDQGQRGAVGVGDLEAGRAGSQCRDGGELPVRGARPDRREPRQRQLVTGPRQRPGFALAAKDVVAAEI